MILALFNVFGGDRGESGAPFGAEAILHGKRNGNQYTNGAVEVCSFGGVKVSVLQIRAGEEDTGEVSHTGYDGGEIVAAIPEAIPGGLIAEDKHETDDYG